MFGENGRCLEIHTESYTVHSEGSPDEKKFTAFPLFM